MLYQIVLALHTLIAIGIIVLVFLQHGKGADIGAAFGSGASNTVFGSKGSAGPLYKLTAVFAIMFCITSISLTAILTQDRKAQLDITEPNTSSIQEPVSNSNSNSISTDVPVVPN